MRLSPPRGGGSGGRRRQKKSVATVYGAVSGALLLVIAAVALIVRPPSPPALAEFAPQTDQAIDDTSENQSSRFGTGGDGICSAGQLGCEGVGRPATTVPPDDDDEEQDSDRPPRRPGLDCIGTPGRQTRDPQSPPCADPWEGDNGGATSMGVTRDEIRVALAPSLNTSSIEELQQVVGFFNYRFEFYGRRIVLVDKQGAPSTGPTSPQTELQRRKADYVAEARPFAAVRFGVGSGSQLAFRSRLADHGVVSVHTDDDYTTEAQLRSLHPYAWNYHLGYDRLLTDLAQFVCRSLTPGTAAAHAGPGVEGQERAVGVVNILPARAEFDGDFGDIGPFLDGLDACGGAKVVKEYKRSDDTGNPSARRLVSELQAADVTTVVPLGAPAGANDLMPIATQLGYYPEWLFAGGGSFDQLQERWQPPSADANQTAHLIALGGWNKGLPRSDQPSTWAYSEQGVDTGLDNASRRRAETFYQAMLIVASGIQEAGPMLTPETFAKGLQKARFPNPGAGAPPYYQATVGFTGDHTMIDDEAIQWWSASAPAYRDRQEEGGGWCYVARGVRWRRDAWPRQTFPLFDPATPCR